MGGERLAHPLDTAWVSTGGTGAQNYDEFSSDTEITDIVAKNPTSLLSVEMPQCTPEAREAGRGFAESLPYAEQQLQRLKNDGRLAPFADVVCSYRIESGHSVTYGLFCMIDTAQISGSADQPGRVIRNEDVFPEKVSERQELITSLHHVLSPVLLVQSGRGDGLHAHLADVIAGLGEPEIVDVDQLDQRHSLWVLGPSDERDVLLELVSEGDLIVADGNHRTLAAQQAGLDRFLAVVTSPGSVTIRPYHRLVRDLGLPTHVMQARLREAGCIVVENPGEPTVPDAPGAIHVYLGKGSTVEVVLPPALEGATVDRLDHSLVERVVLNDVLGMDAGDKRITYVGGDYPVEWLTGEVDAGRAAAAMLIAPVNVDDFLQVNLDRQKMPRKSTWFTPKARCGLVVAELPAAVPAAG
jgi:uncharacterized protein (DUF1015 family)